MLAAVGQITLYWNDLEEALERLLWYYIGSDEKGHIITAGMGNVTRVEKLDELADCLEAIPQIVEHLGCFTAAFDVLRLNRNAIVHAVGHGLSHEGEEYFFERLKKSVRTREYDSFGLPLVTLQTLAEQISELTKYGGTLLLIMRRRAGLIKQDFFDWPKPPPWPEKFPLPDKIR